jgi:hypothetical protein
MQEDRPGSSLREAIRNLGIAFSQIGFAQNTTWLMYSKADNAYAKIESIWVDNAWDTQRRRGLKPTQRNVFDVQ